MGAPEISRPSRGGRLRLTRRGRAVLLGLYLVVAIGLAVMLAPASRASDPPGPAPTAVVLPGDTLWSVAERHRPSRQPFRVIDEIRRLNGIEGYTIQPGQRLTLPHEK